MSLALSTASVTSSAASVLTLEPGQTVTLCASATTYLGTANTVTTSGATEGFNLPASVPVTFTLLNDEGAAPVTLYAITASTATLSIAVTGSP